MSSSVAQLDCTPLAQPSHLTIALSAITADAVTSPVPAGQVGQVGQVGQAGHCVANDSFETLYTMLVNIHPAIIMVAFIFPELIVSHEIVFVAKSYLI